MNGVPEDDTRDCPPNSTYSTPAPAHTCTEHTHTPNTHLKNEIPTLEPEAGGGEENS